MKERTKVIVVVGVGLLVLAALSAVKNEVTFRPNLIADRHIVDRQLSPSKTRGLEPLPFDFSINADGSLVKMAEAQSAQEAKPEKPTFQGAPYAERAELEDGTVIDISVNRGTQKKTVRTLTLPILMRFLHLITLLGTLMAQ